MEEYQDLLNLFIENADSSTCVKAWTEIMIPSILKGGSSSSSTDEDAMQGELQFHNQIRATSLFKSHSDAILESPCFLNYDLEKVSQLVEFLKHSGVEDELIFQAILSWCDHDLLARKGYRIQLCVSLSNLERKESKGQERRVPLWKRKILSVKQECLKRRRRNDDDYYYYSPSDGHTEDDKDSSGSSNNSPPFSKPLPDPLPLPESEFKPVVTVKSERTTKTKQREEMINNVTTALRIYNDLYGTHWVSQGFIIPVTDPTGEWPKHIHGMRLGVLLNNIRRRRDQYSEEHIVALERAGMLWKCPSQAETLISALKIYKSIHDTAWVPEKFVVPNDSANWPTEMQGMKLGTKIASARANAKQYTAKEIQLFNDAGMIWM